MRYQKYIKLLLLIACVLVLTQAKNGLTAECAQNFSWLPNTEADLAGYKIYYGTSDGGPYPASVDFGMIAPQNERVYAEVPGLTCGTEYFFVCVAYNTQGVESGYSTQVSGVIGSISNVVTKVFGNTAGADYPNTIEDTYINLDQNNNISSASLNTYTWPANMVANAILIKVDLSQIPQDAVIQSAVLQLYATAAGGDSIYAVSSHKVINNNPTLSSATGYTYNGTNTWTSNTSCYNNVPMAQADIGPSESTNNIDMTLGYKSWDITQMINDWLANPESNYGLLLNSDAVATTDSYRNFASSEAADTNQRPLLGISYSDGEPKPTIISISTD
ncbi:Fibronectin type III domain-containing protein [Desulfofustis glycolicus DSM 9705]|uniref:Fibronectin type III domain-containing protein n=2 Tax=Desulfofustis glycolicus TaxID=51195 RepID=A0A1M5WA34_9BACT|nr:Fibronectin type III domain-containing protein [Desulfofustis glycolicus DSM 9705]